MSQPPTGYSPVPPSTTAAVEVDENVVIEPFRPDLSLEALPPPPAAKPFSPQVTQQLSEPVLDTRPFTETDARESLAAHIASTWFARRKFEQNMIITDIAASNTYVADLDTFLESRKLKPAFRPMRELIHTLDGPNMGPAPGPWQIEAHPRALFADSDMAIQLPHTEEVRLCHTCRGRGDVRCSHCHGLGNVRCHHCNGSGHVTRSSTDSQGRATTTREHCHHCSFGQTRCFTCGARGWVTCGTCDGYRNLIHFIQLTIEWRNKRQRAVVDAQDDALSANERTKLASSDAVSGAQGPLVFCEEDVVLSIRDDQAGRVNHGVNASVNRLLQLASDPTMLQHRQRLMVRGLPVYRVSYMDKGEPHFFWIIGTNRAVHAPDLPKDVVRVAIASVLALLLLAAIIGAIGAVVYFVV